MAIVRCAACGAEIGTEGEEHLGMAWFNPETGDDDLCVLCNEDAMTAREFEMESASMYDIG